MSSLSISLDSKNSCPVRSPLEECTSNGRERDNGGTYPSPITYPPRSRKCNSPAYEHTCIDWLSMKDLERTVKDMHIIDSEQITAFIKDLKLQLSQLVKLQVEYRESDLTFD